MKKSKIAILGATSHIAKGLINNFIQNEESTLHLFSRSADKIQVFLNTLKNDFPEHCVIHEGYQDFSEFSYDVIINCVGAGTLNKHRGDYSSYFTIIEEYDNLIISYLRCHSDALYISFSSGAIYGDNYSTPMDENTINHISVNHVKPGNYYTIARLNAEAKHRAFKDLNIVDLRIFSYFSRFADLTDGYFITEIVSCILKNEIFVTSDSEIIRDYLHPDDLFAAILGCMKVKKINMAFDLASASPISKKEIIDFFFRTYNLKCKIDESFEFKGATGNKNIYYSVYDKAAVIGYQPRFRSVDTIEQESKYILNS